MAYWILLHSKTSIIETTVSCARRDNPLIMIIRSTGVQSFVLQLLIVKPVDRIRWLKESRSDEFNKRHRFSIVCEL